MPQGGRAAGAGDEAPAVLTSWEFGSSCSGPRSARWLEKSAMISSPDELQQHL